MSDKKPIAAKKTTDPQGAAVIQATPLLIGPIDDTVPITVQRRTSVRPANAFRLIGVANQTEAWDRATA
jgi:hypothetical protein